MSGDFGELVLVVGDFHIPDRAANIPEKFQKMLVPNKMQHVLCTGNLTSIEQYEDLNMLASSVHFVRGDFDQMTSLPETKVVQIGQFRIGLVHGHQVIPWGDHLALAAFQRELDVDILISGHTHRNEVTEYEGKWFINPGSITGAFSPLDGEDTIVPSFILLAIQGARVVAYVYELRDGEVEVSKTEFEKP